MEVGIALQLYTMRQQAARDFVGTLRDVAGAGYRAVELFGYGGLDPRDLRTTLDELGMTAVSAHVPYRRLDTEIDRVLEELAVLGCSYAITSASDEHRAGAEAVRRLAETFDEWGDRCRRANVAFGFHNHDADFTLVDGTTMFELLATETRPELVSFQVDVHWVRRAGFDPVELIGRLAGRVPTVHAKDLSERGDSDTPVGDGVMPWLDLLHAAAASGTRWMIVEQEDDPDNATRDIGRSRENLERLIGSA
jgi:sugar phosphate isomerase/epimerase